MRNLRIEPRIGEFQIKLFCHVFALTPVTHVPKRHHFRNPLLLRWWGGQTTGQRRGSGPGMGGVAQRRRLFFPLDLFSYCASNTSPHMPGAPFHAHLRLPSDPGPPVRSRKRNTPRLYVKSAQSQYPLKVPYKANSSPENPDATSLSGGRGKTRNGLLPSARLHRRSGRPSHRGWCVRELHASTNVP